MLTPPANARIWLCTAPADLRKSFDGLCGLIRSWLGSDPLCGALFVFHNKRGDRVKILTFEGDGLAIYYKRLEAGRFHFPRAADGSRQQSVRAADLLMLLDGVDLESVRRRPRYQRPPQPA
jgi:transposase